MKIVLASRSPRRRQLLGVAGIDFTDALIEFEEVVIPGRSEETVRFNAEHKAVRATHRLPDAAVIGCDTVVYLDRILGKPKSVTDARRMLKLLSGKTHQVYSAVSLFLPFEDRPRTKTAVTAVKFQPLNAATIREYSERVYCLDKAGGYAIQEEGEMIVEEIRGSLSNVIGLPLETLAELLSDTPGLEAVAADLRKVDAHLDREYSWLSKK